jgi:hypothetical protein
MLLGRLTSPTQAANRAEVRLLLQEAIRKQAWRLHSLKSWHPAKCLALQECLAKSD